IPGEKGILEYIADLLLEFKPADGGRIPNEVIVRCAKELHDLKDERGKKLRWRDVGQLLDVALPPVLKKPHVDPEWAKQYVKRSRIEKPQIGQRRGADIK